MKNEYRSEERTLSGELHMGGIFDLNRIEGELEESEQRLSTILATVQVGILIIDPETHTIVDVNPKAAAIIGSRREEIIGSPCSRFVCQEKGWRCPITELGQEVDHAERRMSRADGECITIVKTVARVKLRGREHLVESFLDISGRKATEEALKVSEGRYHDLLENANDLIQSVSADGSFIYVNRAWKEVMGYTDQEIAALKVFDVISPTCREHCALLFQEIMSGKVIARVDVQFTAKNGRVVELEGSINCNSVDGKPPVTRGIFRDITERKAMERELQQSEDRYRKLFENAPEAIVVHSEGRYIQVNTQACHLFGVESSEQLIGAGILASIAPDYREMARMRILRIAETGIPSGWQEIKILRRDGSAIDVEVIGTGITFQGKPATQAILRDITERKRVEEHQKQWSIQLEQKVEEKTRHLKEAQAKLIQTEKMATLSEVISGASHELNNPLAGILGAIQVLRSSALSHPIGAELMESVDVLQDMQNAAIRCQNIVDDLIRFSAQASCNFSPMDINQVLKDTLEILGEQFAELGIRVNWCMDPQLPSIEGDFVKLLEVFVNLLQNAKSALPAGGDLEIATKHVKEYAELPQVVICIRDSGCGIAPQKLGKIFDPFYTTKPHGKGPGLGLTVCYGIVKRHNGEIEVRSSLGKWTEVSVTLPLKQPGTKSSRTGVRVRGI
jgi:PAS domain S-box-containing protein